MPSVAKFHIIRQAKYLTFSQKEKILPDNAVYLILKGYVIIKTFKKGLLGMTLIKAKTKYEGEHFFAGSLLTPDPDDDDADLIREFYVFFSKTHYCRLWSK